MTKPSDGNVLVLSSDGKEFQQGQRLRAEWPDGSVMEGLCDISAKYAGGVGLLHFNGHSSVDWVKSQGAVVTIVAYAPVVEPTLVGAIVIAAVYPKGPLATWSLAGNQDWTADSTKPKFLWASPGYDPRPWKQLFNQDVRFTGWKPS